MLHLISVWLLVAGFAGAGLVNTIGRAGTRSDFARWGYPGWWHLLTGVLEIIDAGLIALPQTRISGLVLGALIIAAAILTLLRHREFPHLAPLGAFALLIAAAMLSS